MFVFVVVVAMRTFSFNHTLHRAPML
jgi:hypothetical protein